MVIIQALVTFGPTAKKMMMDQGLTKTKEFLQREAWRAILLCSKDTTPSRSFQNTTLLQFKVYSANIPQMSH